jgi:hypothetical protein
MAYQAFPVDVTIANGSSTSDPIRITGLIVVGVSLPSTIAGTRLALQVRTTASDSFRMVRNAAGPVHAGIAGNSFLVFPVEVMDLLTPFDAIRFATLDNSNNAVNQTSNVTLRVFLSPR